MRAFLTRVKAGLVLSLALVCFIAGTASANPEVYRHTMSSMVYIESLAGSGSGTLIEVGGRKLILTAGHVVDNQPNVFVLFAAKDSDGDYIHNRSFYKRNGNKLVIRGTVIAKDATTDVALIELERIPEGARALPLAGLSARKGDLVHAVGCTPQIYNGQFFHYRGCKVQVTG